MNESNWLACSDPQLMLAFLKGKASERKLRLFALGYCRSIWHLLTDQRSRQDVVTAERFADRLATRSELEAAWAAVFDPDRSLPEWAVLHTTALIPLRSGTFSNSMDWGEAFSVVHVASREGAELTVGRVGNRELSGLLRDIFGNPFRPIRFNPAWRTPTVTAVATAAYEERSLPAGTLDANRLAVLADALEDAGCTNLDILAHCRDGGPHVRGCWMIDLVLGKS